jgi:hypothetical protein
MNKIYKILSVFVFCVVLASCGGNNTTEDTPLRDYATQYATDLGLIDQYIDTHYLTYDADYNVTFDTLLPSSGHSSIRTDVAFHLSDTTVAEDGINYKIYFIKFREGDALNGKRPTQVDSVHVAYRGVNLKKSAQFDVAQLPVWFKLQEVITGWSHIIPNFKTGTYTAGTGGNATTFNNFGAGVMFLPSGLAYYNNSAGTIPVYSPIIFNFKLYELQYRDQDGDGILSKDERILSPITASNKLTRWRENPYLGYDLNGDGTIDTSSTLYDSDGDGIVDSTELFDTDRDGIPNMYDIDDDGDNFTTKSETLQYVDPVTGKRHYYKYDGAAVDNPLTFYDETKGIPDCSGNFTSPTRKRKYLDPDCHYQP